MKDIAPELLESLQEKFNDGFNESEKILRLNNLLEEIIASNCNKTVKEYSKFVYKKDCYLDANAALKFGIVDEILPKKDKFIHPQYIK